MARITLELQDGQYPLPSKVLPYSVNCDGNQFSLDYAKRGGGNGLVVSAKQYKNSSLIRTCAVKFLRRLDDQRRDRFTNEIRIAKSLKHNNIAEYFGDGEIYHSQDHSIPWMAQELGGYNFREHVMKKGPLQKIIFKSIAIQMCDAIEHLHSHGFIHRDIKPDNFVWVENSNTECLMIDFGIAKRLTEDVSARALDQFTRDQEFVGPQQYSSPELIAYASNKKTVVDTRSDIFQLGKTLWFLATGQVSAGIPSKKMCPFGGGLHSLIIQLLEDDPTERLQTIAEVRAALSDLH